MNTKNNQRFQETDQKIQDCFLSLLNQKQISRITVQEICNQVGINRSSFYAHYEDIYALLHKISQNIGKELMSRLIEPEYDPSVPISEAHLCIILEHIKKNASFYRGWLGDMGTASTEQFFHIILENTIKPWLHQLGIISDRRIEYHFAFFKAGLMAVVEQWLAYNCDESPEEITEVILSSIREPQK